MTLSMKEVLAACNITAHTVRYYEKQGLLSIPRNVHGVREFDEPTVARLKSVVHYRNAGIPVKAIKQIFDQPDNVDLRLEFMYEARQNIIADIEKMQETLGYLNNKINLHTKKNAS